jgi:signal transduction histidine kinase
MEDMKNPKEMDTSAANISAGKLPVLRLLYGYVREKRRTIGFFLAGMLLFFLVCLLYHMENLSNLLYAFFLWAFSALCCGIFDFLKYIRKYEAFRAAIENTENLLELLPSPSGAIDRQYHLIIEKLANDLRRLKSEVSLKDSDMNDYYSMWAHQIKIPISAMRLLLQSSGENVGAGIDETGGEGTGEDNEERRRESAGAYKIEGTAENTGTDNEEGSIAIAAISNDAGRVQDSLKISADKSRNKPVTKLLFEELFKIEQYVDMVMYYQRLESISSDFLFRKYDLYDIVKQTLKKYAILFINSKLSLDLQEFECFVVTDEKWLQFALGQIISNALKYTPRGGISIYLEKTSGNAQLVVRDTGIGIRPEDLPRIFERGYTGYNGRLDKKSTGIGLYLCKRTLDKLSHTIEVSSEVGKGTKVTIGFSLEAANDF